MNAVAQTIRYLTRELENVAIAQAELLIRSQKDQAVLAARQASLLTQLSNYASLMEQADENDGSFVSSGLRDMMERVIDPEAKRQPGE